MESLINVLRPYDDLIGKDHRLWQVSRFDRVMDFVFGRVDKVVNLFIEKIDQLEKLPVSLTGDKPHTTEIDYSRWIIGVENVVNHLKTHRGSSSTIAKLARRLHGLRYRITHKHGGIDPLAKNDNIVFSEIYKKFVDWKDLPDQKFNLDKNDVSKNEKAKLQQIERYADFAKEALSNDSLRESLFHWISRLKGDVDLFVEFPHLAEKMATYNVQSWVGYIDNEIVKVDTSGGLKTVQMKYKNDEGIKNVSLLDDEQEVILEMGLKISIGDFFKTMHDKVDITHGRVSLCHEGLIHWDTHMFGRWNEKNEIVKIDVKKDKWWEQLPVVKIISEKKAKKKYGKELGKKDSEIAMNLCASRETPTVNIYGHAYNELALPIQNKKEYALYHFGKVADVYPVGILQLFAILFKFVPSVILYFEDNLSLKNRQITWTTTLINDQALQSVMQRVAASIEKGRKGWMRFQLFCSPCSIWALKTYNVAREAMNLAKIDPFKIHFTKIDSAGVIWFFLLPTKILPTRVHNLYLSFIFLLGAPWRTTTFKDGNNMKTKSCWWHKRWWEKIIHVPSMLHRLQEEAKRLGEDPHGILPRGKLKPRFLIK